MIKIASAIAILTGAIVVLSLIDSAKLASAITALTGLFAELMTSMAIFTKISGDLKNAGKTATIMLGLSVSVLILASALKKIASLSWNEIAKGLTGITVISGVLAGVAKVISKDEKTIAKGAFNLIFLATAVKILASACKDISQLSWGELGKGLTGVGVLMAEIALFLNTAKFSGKAVSTATGILVLSAAIKVLASACKDFGSMQWSEIGKGLTSIGILLTEIAAFTNLTGNAKHVVSTGIALIAIAGAMKIMASAVEDFGSMQWDEIGRGLTVMAGALAEHFGAIEGASIDANKGAYSSAWMIIFGVIAAIMVLIGIYHIKMLPSTQVPSTTKKTASEVGHELVAVIANFFTKKHILYYICFIILYRLAEGFIMKIAPLFLRASRDVGGLGLSLTEIGTLNGIFGSAAFVLGSLLAGIYVSKFGLKKTLFTLCCIFNLPFVAYTFLAVAQPTNVYLIGTCITMEYFGYGFGFVGLTLFMMQQIAPGKHQMSHYAFASGIMNLGVMLPGMVSGYLSDLLGYRNFFIYVLIATIPAFLITYFIPFTYDDSKNK